MSILPAGAQQLEANMKRRQEELDANRRREQDQRDAARRQQEEAQLAEKRAEEARAPEIRAKGEAENRQIMLGTVDVLLAGSMLNEAGKPGIRALGETLSRSGEGSGVMGALLSRIRDNLRGPGAGPLPADPYAAASAQSMDGPGPVTPGWTPRSSPQPRLG